MTVLEKIRGIRKSLRLVNEPLDELADSYMIISKIGEVSKDASLLEKLNNELDIVECQLDYLSERILSVCDTISPVEPRLQLDDIIRASGVFVPTEVWNIQRGANETDPHPTGSS